MLYSYSTMPGLHILLVEDEADAARLLAGFLRVNDFAVSVFHDGESAWRAWSEDPHRFALGIFDVMVPQLSGLKLLQRIRTHDAGAQFPVILLTARDQERYEIEGLEAGADDYITKPASLKRVLAHVQTLIRRLQLGAPEQPSDLPDALHFGPLELKTDSKQTRIAGKFIDLTATEFRLLYKLVAQPDRVFERQELLEELDEDKPVFDRTIDVHIKNIRLKLGKRHGKLIKTFRGVGYGMNPSYAEA